MTQVVGGIGMSHAPGLTGWPDAPPPDVQERIRNSVSSLRDYLLEANPDVIVAFLDDHFDNLSRNLMPPLALGVADRHVGPPEHYFGMLRMDRTLEIPGSRRFAEALLRSLVAQDFDIARLGETEYCQNLMVPLHLVWPENQFPVVPLYINVFSPPLISPARAFELGAAIRRFVEERSERVLFLATGGLSHWPPFWNDQSPEDDELLQRMKRFQTEGRHVLVEDPELFDDFGRYEIEMAAKSDHLLVSEDWDRRFLQAFSEGDTEFMTALTVDKIAQDAGPGGNEVLNWIALMGAMKGAPATVLSYDVSPEWITGVAFTLYR
jgi:2,3-dihydroxyphenylpropionate 1,2-dioxygenase